jgi:hypothetical protein
MPQLFVFISLLTFPVGRQCMDRNGDMPKFYSLAGALGKFRDVCRAAQSKKPKVFAPLFSKAATSFPI